MKYPDDMQHTCFDCGRPNAPHKATCMYCGGALPEPTAPPPNAVALPDDIDALVRQAMTLGTTHKLQAAMVAHNSELEEASEAEPGEEAKEPLVTLRELMDAAARAHDAHENNDPAARDSALAEVRTRLTEWGPVLAEAPKPPQAPDVLLPRTRRPFALVLEGLNDANRGHAIAATLNVDGVTARMIALAKQPRVVLRSDTPDRLEALATALRSELNVAAAVVEPGAMVAVGPASLLVGFEHGPETIAVHDWTAEPPESGRREQVKEAPLLVVPGEVMVMKARAVRGGGRLKHLREGRTTPSSERRVAVVDLHLLDGIVRMVEGATDLSDAPAAVEGSFRSSIRRMMDDWAAAGVRVLESRTVTPSGHAVGSRTGEDGGQVTTSWPEWEEHTRSCRALFIDRDSVPQLPEEALGSHRIDPI